MARRCGADRKRRCRRLVNGVCTSPDVGGQPSAVALELSTLRINVDTSPQLSDFHLLDAGGEERLVSNGWADVSQHVWLLYTCPFHLPLLHLRLPDLGSLTHACYPRTWLTVVAMTSSRPPHPNVAAAFASSPFALRARTARQRRKLRRLSCCATTAATPPLVRPPTHALADPAHFPILDQVVHDDRRLVYLDSAATSQKPRAVIDALVGYYERDNSNVHRGAHSLAARATDAFEGTRKKVATLINSQTNEVVYTRNATEAINLVAATWAAANIRRGDEIVVSAMEHHANLVPWQLLANRVGARVVAVRLSDDHGAYDLDHLRQLLTSGRVRLVACVHVSNVLGCVNPVREIAALAHDAGALCLVDACQSVPHMRVDVRELDCDFLVASSHKMCGPTGVGFLYGKYALLENMPPYMGGGEMIADVFLDGATYAEPPHKFEAGTPPIGEVVAFGAAIDYLNTFGMDAVHQYELAIGAYLYQRLSSFEQIDIYGPPPPRAALCAFNVRNIHSGDLATMLDLDGVAVRSGHHCAQPLHRELGVNSSARASLYVYNSTHDVDVFIESLKEAVAILGGSLTENAHSNL